MIDIEKFINDRFKIILLVFNMLGTLFLSSCADSGNDPSDPKNMLSSGISLFEDNSYAKAKEKLTGAAAIFEARGDTLSLAEASGYLGNISFALGEYRSAVEKFSKAVQLCRYVNDYRSEALWNLKLGDLYASIDENQRALKCYETSLATNSAFSNNEGKAEASARIAQLYTNINISDRAEKYFLESVDLYRLAGDSAGVARSFSELSKILAKQNRLTEAIGYNSLAFLASSRVSDPILLANIRISRGNVFRALNSHVEARKNFLEAANFLGSKKVNIYRPLPLFYTARSWTENGDLLNAKRYLNEALTAAKEANDYMAEQYLTLFAIQLDEMFQRSGESRFSDYDLAMRYVRVGSRFNELGNHSGESYALGCAARLYAKAGNFEYASRTIKRAIELDESQYGEYFSGAIHKPYRQELDLENELASHHQLLAEVSLYRGLDTLALQALDRGNMLRMTNIFYGMDPVLRHPQLANIVAGVRTEIFDKRLLDVEISGVLYGRRSASAIASTVPMQAQSDRLAASIAQTTAKVVRQYPNYGPYMRVNSATISELQPYVPHNALIVSYLAGSKHLFIFTLTRSSFKVIRTNNSGEIVRRMLKEYRQLLNDSRIYSGSDTDFSIESMMRFDQLSEQLYGILIQPIESLLDKDLIVVGYGDFDGFPFHSLKRSDYSGKTKYLIENTNVQYLATLASIKYRTADTRRAKTIVAFGNPAGNNWSTDYELRDIRNIIRNATFRVGIDASWQNLSSNNSDILQLVTDFYVRPNGQELGEFTLSNGITTGGTERLPFDYLTQVSAPSVFILSNQSQDGSALSSAHAMLLRMNGSPDVILNFWSADRKASKFFSEYFYTNIGNGFSPSDAYRQALLNLLKTRETRHPRSWAQFYNFGIGL